MPALCLARHVDPSPNDFRDGLVALLPELRARSMRLCADAVAADDVVQDTFERALRFEHRYEAGTNLRAWAGQVLFSVFATRWRRRRRDTRALERLGIDPHAWPHPRPFAAPDAGPNALMPSARRTLEALPERYRIVLEIVDLEERSYRDAASALGIPIGTVMSRLSRARRLLAVQMSIAAPAARVAPSSRTRDHAPHKHEALHEDR